jgi:hypothetical protein
VIPRVAEDADALRLAWLPDALLADPLAPLALEGLLADAPLLLDGLLADAPALDE